MIDRPDNLELGEVIMSAEEISEVVAHIGRKISLDYVDRHPILVNLLKGGVVFLADLIRRITVPHTIEFMTVSSYEDGASRGIVRIVEDLTCSIEGRDVLIIEDVIDTGTTLAYIMDILRLRNPKSITVCTLLRKAAASQSGVSIQYVGKEIPNTFVVGYGLDYNEHFRHLPYIAELALDT